MSNGGGSSGFILFTLIACIGVFVWVFDGMPVPGVEVRPLQANPGLGSFQAAGVETEQQRRERQRGTTGIPRSRQGDDNPERNAIRQEVMDAYKSYKRATCNASKRKRLYDAMVALDAAMHTTWRRCRNGGCGGTDALETWRTPFDLTVRHTIAQATEDGLIEKAELMHLFGVWQFAKSATDNESVDTYRRCQR